MFSVRPRRVGPTSAAAYQQNMSAEENAFLRQIGQVRSYARVVSRFSQVFRGRAYHVAFNVQGARGHQNILWTGASTVDCGFIGRLNVFDVPRVKADAAGQQPMRLRLNGSIISAECGHVFWLTEDAVDYEDYYTKVHPRSVTRNFAAVLCALPWLLVSSIVLRRCLCSPFAQPW